jgi:rhamnose utilization protein RhaD (predicted bifunctional aldolase and dehydrogenase)/NAD(P)-dependent dehydrogenase (short-subunit alcohol dehydrogenase family)
MASEYNWGDFDWDNMEDDLDRIVALSRYYGSDPDFLLAGGGNTSMKTEDTLYIKASGFSLANIERHGFVPMDREKVGEILVKSYSRDPFEREAEVKSDMLAARVDPESSARPSVETMFHDLINYKFVVHTHPSLINGLTCSKKGKAIAAEIFGDDAIWIDYAPGYMLAKKVQSALLRYRKDNNDREPKIILLQNHGVFVGADDPEEVKIVMDGIVDGLKAYMEERKSESIFGERSKAFPEESDQKDVIRELIPAIRGSLTHEEAGEIPPIVSINKSELAEEFAASERGEVLARSEAFTPDQIVYCKRIPLWIGRKAWDEDIDSIRDRMQDAVDNFVDRYGYPPKVIIVQGLGLFGVGDSKKSADTASIVYEDAIKIMKNSVAFGGPSFMTNKQAKFIDEWEVESYRRKIAAAEISAGRVGGKVAIVTGAAQGFGEGIARELTSEGAYTVIADINLEGAQIIADELNSEYGEGKSIAVKVDVSNEESVENMILQTVKEYGGIDILVSNAGVLRAGSVKTLALRDFDFVTRVNYIGYFLCVKHAAPVMTAQHKYDPEYRSDIIQINSKSGLQGSNKNAAYAGSKFGGIGLTQSFALELAEDGIKVNSICPGNFLDGPLWSDPENGLFVQYLRAGKVPGAKTIEDVRKAYEEKVPMGRGCTVKDVMKAIYYVIEQSYETGQAIPVTGGQLMK